MLGEPPRNCPAHRADRHRGQQLWGEQTDDHPDAGTPPQSLAAQVIPGRHDRNVAVLVVGDQNHALHLHLLGLDKTHHRVEVPAGRSQIAISSHQQIGQFLTHDMPPFPGDKYDTATTEAIMFADVSAFSWGVTMRPAGHFQHRTLGGGRRKAPRPIRVVMDSI